MQTEPFVLNVLSGRCGIVSDLAYYIVHGDSSGKLLIIIRARDVRLSMYEHREMWLSEDSIIYGNTIRIGPGIWHRLKRVTYTITLEDDTGMVLKTIKKSVFRGSNFKLKPFHNEIYTLLPGRKLILHVKSRIYNKVEEAEYILLPV